MVGFRSTGMKRRLPHVVGFRLPIDQPHVKYKMGQDELLPHTRAAIDRLEDNLGPALAGIMRHESEERD